MAREWGFRIAYLACFAWAAVAAYGLISRAPLALHEAAEGFGSVAGWLALLRWVTYDRKHQNGA